MSRLADVLLLPFRALRMKRLASRCLASEPYAAGRNQLTRDEAGAMSAACPERPLVSFIVTPAGTARPVRSVQAQFCGESEILASGGVDAAKGRFTGFLDADDELSPDALAWVADAVRRNPQAKWIYSDEDLLSESGEAAGTRFKPDYSPSLVLAQMFTGRLSLYDTELLRRIAHVASGEHDIALRISEIVADREVVHIPRVLSHRHGSWAPSATSAKAVESALARRGIAGTVSTDPACPGVVRIRVTPKSAPRVSIIIPTRNGIELLRRCLAALRERTRYPNYEVVVIDNRSDDPALKTFLAAESAAGRLRVMRYDKPFNHSEMNNLAARSAESEMIVLMNNDVEVTSDGWLEQLVGVAGMDASIAGVGGMLCFPDGRVQHGGILLGIRGLIDHAHKGLDLASPGYGGRLQSLQEFCALTGAMLLLKRDAFLSAGSFRAERYPTSYNDVDLCLRLRAKGRRFVYTPEVRAIHRETSTRRIGLVEEQGFHRTFLEDWGDVARRDPFYNPNLSLADTSFECCREFPVETDATIGEPPHA